MGEPQEYLADGTPLITAAQLGKLRLVRLLVEGGAQVNERNQRGETPLLAACRALRGDRGGGGGAANNANSAASTLRLLRFLLENGADPNAQDRAGRTALMYACMEKAGPAVAAALVGAGADPSMEDYAGASALVYAVNAREPETLRVLLDACRERGRDIIIIATDLSGGGAGGAGGSPVTRRYLNVPPSPDHSPVSCMSPSEIELRSGGSPGSESEAGENFFNFRGTGKRGSGGGGAEGGAGAGGGAGGRRPHGQRLHSEPWLAIHNLAHLRSSYEEGLRQAAVREDEEEGEEEDEEEEQLRPHKPRDPRVRRRSSLHPYSGLDPCYSDPPGTRTSLKPLPPGGALPHLGRRNTLSCLQDTPLLQLPSLTLNHAGSDSYLQAPPPGTPAVGPGHRREQYSSTWSLVSTDCTPATDATGRKKSFLPPLPTCPAARPPAPPPTATEMSPRPPQTMPRLEGWRGRRLQRRHSIQLEPVGQVGQVEQVGQDQPARGTRTSLLVGPGPACSWDQDQPARGTRTSLLVGPGPACSWDQDQPARGTRTSLLVGPGPACSWDQDQPARGTRTSLLVGPGPGPACSWDQDQPARGTRTSLLVGPGPACSWDQDQPARGTRTSLLVGVTRHKRESAQP
ncbi:ankyrin repeat domain-containing protein 34B [Anguilla rostrata]|uniref:ankyrin repeat domain-containing protein 34B n=1 Tax=Anguilla rostrata TaxID=7938 RepID=UPI0030CC098D